MYFLDPLDKVMQLFQLIQEICKICFFKLSLLVCQQALIIKEQNKIEFQHHL